MPPPTRPYRLMLTTWQPFGAGSIQSVEYLARGLHARGHEVRVACPSHGVLGRRLEQAGVPVVDVDFGAGWSLAAARRLAAAMREHDTELLDAQESQDRKAAVLARTVLRTPNRLVVTRRQMSATFPPVNLLYSLAADRVIAISHGVAADLAARGMVRSRISVVHTGLDPCRVARPVTDALLEALRRELGLDPALPTVGVVARRKDQETLLRAAVHLGKPVNLLFAGIHRDASLAALEPPLPAGCRVAYTGFREDVIPLYHLMDVMALTTLREGLSQALLEAMALGIPVATAAVGGTPELVQDGTNGLHFPPGDAVALAQALTRLLDEPELGARLAGEARRTVAGPFHRDVFVRRTEEVYRNLLEGP